MIYTSQQLQKFAQNAGFQGNALQTIVAIAQAESSGNTEAVNHSDPYGGSYGVLQINGAHIQGLGGNSINMQCATDAQCSFNYAYQLYSAQGFTPWSTYTSGAYKNYLNGTSSTVSSPVSGSSNPTDILSSLNSILPWLNNPMRIFKMIGGVVLVGISLLLLLYPDVAPKAMQAAKAALVL